MAEINITYETLFELLRREKNREELQELTPEFHQDVAQYLQTKEKLAQESQDSKNQKQLENAKKLLKELYEKREKKIVTMALYRSRSGTDFMKTDNLLVSEKGLYDEIKEVCDRYRDKDAADIPKPVEPEKPVEDIEVKFLAPVPKFVGRELETYGPFDSGDVANLPTEIAKVLIKKDRAEAVQDKDEASVA